MSTMIEKALGEMAYIHMKRMIKKRPLDINIETVNFCPMKCVFCCNRLYRKEYTVMDNTLFEKIVKEYYHMGGGTIAIGSMQSDLFSDPLFMDRMRIIKKYKKRLWLYSTTTLITCKKYSDKELLYILRLFDYFQVSIEGYDRETYRQLAGVDGFDILAEQLKRVKRLIKDNSLTVRIEIYFRTYDKLSLFRSNFYRQVKHMFFIREVKDTFFSRCGVIEENDLPKGAKIGYSYNQGKKNNCVVPNATLSVQANGKVLGCPCIDWLEKYPIGDCKKNTLVEIWKSERAARFRNAFERGKLPPICEECGLYLPMNVCLKSKKLLRYQSINGLYYLKSSKNG